ncbi:7650_t:CDS:2 [Ambispora leptoticha]|uniref:Large ribosomal subunit protein bL31c n=1 Tax=Ambispora leptoticha TaxID=144679 RepID=A0A9N9GJV6_9GLOM|nr:7650_t:CDS:2 [Ambispora leptoticha]
MLKSLVKEEDFDPFLQNNQNKRVLVKFSTVWCPPCQVLQKSIEELLNELETTAGQPKDLIVLQVDAEKFPRLAQRPLFNVEADANRVLIKGEPKSSDLEVKVIDEEGVSDYQDTDEKNIEYIIKKADDCWKIDKKERKIMVKPGKKVDFDKALKEMHKSLLKDKFGSTKIGKRLNADGDDMQYIIMDDGSGNYKVKIYRGDSSDDREFSWEKQYQTVSTSSQDISNSSCSNCNPFYTGTLASEINVGAVEKFRQRVQKVKGKIMLMFEEMFRILEVMGIIKLQKQAAKDYEE